MAARKLVEWFRERARELPWRTEQRDPYHVLVSELMLQQTQVDRVVPRYRSFLRKFPSISDLAAASEEEVLQAWSGLGYYRRARLLHEASKVVERRGGELPEESASLLELPGVGPYTAAAIASLAFGEAAPVLDGNTMRVGSRMLALESDPRRAAGRRAIERWIGSLMVEGSAGTINEALMELGATLCSPSAPSCQECPLASICKARALGRQKSYPLPPARKKRSTEEIRWVASCVIDSVGRWLLRRVDEGPILRGLWLPPLLRIEDDEDPSERGREAMADLSEVEAEVLAPVRHSITYRRLTVVPVRFCLRESGIPGDGVAWVEPDAPDRPTSSLLNKLVARCSSG